MKNAKTLPADPGIVCRDQLTSEVTVHGEGFSPVPIDIPKSPKVALPTISLLRKHNLDGLSVGNPDEVIYSGNPDKDPTNAFDAKGKPLLSWKSQTEMRFVVNQQLLLGAAGTHHDKGMLAEGVWDLEVENADGRAAKSPQSFAVVDKPSVIKAAPGIVCLAQGKRSITMTGERFLRDADAKAVLSVDGVTDPFAVDLADCTKVAQAGIDAEVCSTATVELAQSSIQAGFPALTLDNPETAACKSVDDIKLRVVPAPAIDRVEPSLSCVSEGDRMFVIHGKDFLTVDGTDPKLTVGTKDLAVDSMGGCEDLETQGAKVQRCTSINFTVKKGVLTPDLYTVTVANPDPAGCNNVAMGALRIVPPPVIDRVVPSLSCVAQGDRKFTIQGADFLTVDGTDPMVTIGSQAFAVDAMGGCAALETQGLKVQRCSSIDITVKKNALSPDLYAVSVVNPDPAGCENIAMGALRIVPPPVLMDVQPPLVCVDDADRKVTATGTDFLVVDGKVPAIEIDGQALVAAAIDPHGCSDLTVAGMSVQTCTSLGLTLAMGSVAAGMTKIKVTNPDPAGCSDERSDLLAVVQGPAIASAEPALLCTVDGSKPIAITGSGFLKVGNAVPTVMIGGAAVASVDSLDGCSAVTVHGLSVEACTRVNVTVAKDALAAGRPEVVLLNPDPAGCSATRNDVLSVPPTLAIASITPVNVCKDTVNAAFPVTLKGDGFLRVGSTDATLTFAGSAVTPVFSDCTSLSIAGVSSASDCMTISTTVDLTGKTATVGASYDFVLSNAAAAPACALSETTQLHVVGPPTVSNISIVNVCSDTGFTVIATGTGFVDGATLTFSNSNGKSVMASSVTVNSPTQLTASFTDGLTYDSIDPTFDLVVQNASGCAASPIPNAITVSPTPLVFFVDPPIVYNAITIDATIFTSGMTASSLLQKVEMIDAGGTATTLCDTVAGGSIPDCDYNTAKPNRVVASIPGIDTGTSQPTFTPGDYTVRVTSTLGCTGALPGAVKVTETLDNSLVSKISPSFVSPTKETAVSMTGSGLMSVPRLYLTPHGTSGTGRALRAVTLQSATQLNAIVPAGLTAGNYDLVVVNPDGKVGVLSNGVTVTTGEPPVIDSVVPASLVANGSTTVTATGAGFDVSSMVLECKATSTSTTVTMLTGTLVGTPTATQAKASFNAGTLAAGSICLLKLTNTDGAFFEYSAISTTNSSLNISQWTTSDGSTTPKPTALTMGRRALSLVAGRPTATSRFLYAIGGDNGVSGTNNQATIGSTVFANVETANVDVYGNMGSWSVQSRTPLLAPRTWAGAATVGRFIYLVGGHDGSSATDTLYRAQILDPLATSEFQDLDAVLGDGTHGLGGGLYYYGVAAIFPSNDPSNPSGESLTGELLPVQLPDRTQKIQLTLTWQAVANAHGYRIYRSPTPGASVSAMQLLAEKTCGTTATDTCDCTTTPSQCRVTDDGSVTPSGNGPLPAGALGAWHAVDGARCTSANCSLSVKREALTTVAVRNPSDASKYFLYAVGGRNESGTYQSSYEVAVVSVAGNGTQTVADFTTGGTALSSPRAEVGVWVMTADNSAIIRAGTVTDVWFYLGGGRTTGGGVVTTMQSGKLQANGDIGTSLGTETALKSGGATGLGAGASNDHLYVFGGDATSGKGMSADLASPLPTLPGNAWNSLGNAAASRIYMGATQESAFFFLAGGWFNGATLSSTEQTVQ